MANMSSILLAAIAILTCHTPALVWSQDPPECKEYVEPQASTTLSPKPPRVFPFCIGKDPETQAWPTAIKNTGFDKIIEAINAQSIVDFDGQQHSIYHDSHSSNQQHRVYRLRHQYRNNEFVIMDNWINQEFTTLQKPIAGLYIQAIQGPLGIPFGEFVNLKHTYNSRDDYQPPPSGGSKFSSDDMKKISIVPCTFFSKAGPTIPNVFVWKNGPTRAKFNVTFRWDDPPCAEVAFFQFVMIVVFKWPNDYEPVLSPMILPGKLEFPSVTGLAYPYYPDWVHEEIHTKREAKDGEAFLKITPGGYRDIAFNRIVSNPDYEYCVQHGYNLVKKGPQKGQCPPGPFECDSGYINTYNNEHSDPSKSARTKEALWHHWRKIYKQFQPQRPHCGVAPPPPSTTTTPPTTTTQDPGTGTGTPGITIANVTTALTAVPSTTTPRPKTEAENKTDELAVVIQKTERQKVISHGDLCCLVWFVLISIANFISRCFKDFPNWKGIGVGFWIVAHVVIHHAGVLLMWISFGLVVSNGVSFFGGASGGHYLFGFPCIFIQHYELFSGFIRDSKSVPKAQRQSIIHVVNGYISSVLSLCCAKYSNISVIRWYLIIAMFSVNVVFFFVGTLLEYQVSKRLGMYPARKMFPLMERVVLEGGQKPVLLGVKIIVLVVYTVIVSCLFTLYVLFNDKYIKIQF